MVEPCWLWHVGAVRAAASCWEAGRQAAGQWALLRCVVRAQVQVQENDADVWLG